MFECDRVVALLNRVHKVRAKAARDSNTARWPTKDVILYSLFQSHIKGFLRSFSIQYHYEKATRCFSVNHSDRFMSLACVCTVRVTNIRSPTTSSNRCVLLSFSRFKIEWMCTNPIWLSQQPITIHASPCMGKTKRKKTTNKYMSGDHRPVTQQIKRSDTFITLLAGCVWVWTSR